MNPSTEQKPYGFQSFSNGGIDASQTPNPDISSLLNMGDATNNTPTDDLKDNDAWEPSSNKNNNQEEEEEPVIIERRGNRGGAQRGNGGRGGNAAPVTPHNAFNG